MESEAYNHEKIKAELDDLQRQIAQLEAENNPASKEDRDLLHQRYEALQKKYSADHEHLSRAA
ncbi:MAG: hypothetical protein A3I07_04045 [Candidatus Doudnabacteria bacterium RIFCSPLOWO2_02_FULL_42_9]|uniref:Uncharacterized protein n=1 Tax=Candidatus Doudnabacteria bacterium RIFCSPHIGHO2_01_FULL_41_86 TaxID=1817821 RepID=A0A1F5N9Y1_9BACT|nr:MAG: hypothetical protein A2717_02610 [Candidatus Doudnabacteria bacterium RIFCSPHIGHO2_01_FULL_41_86]OGE75486.1 MAG: hypothetical protein A3K07_00940 [Candidatus Doudnabacteria bacterium RIFCSPHIGHO2_01_43_10]OGE85443.1 MAG: hypothetical protein A3E28_02180 [Candidatus Doudnabacteria bacterium RIFCSPHIGHO2_12_FULL_42_22]OGE86981.1 MAG: hypothetical protein A3C49_03015 [Candidatus Doudnabacteria bacterium RIFCSPHIGHO2_02_FULL_42_25]OGE92580.1 MAG: hypothetical protein A2895_03170 [Candidatus